MKRTGWDAVLAAGVLVAGVGLNSQVYPGGPSPLWLHLALTLPLVWRRRAPVAAFCAVAAAALAQWVADVQLVTDVAVLVALYTVAAHTTWRRALLAGAAVETGVVLASVRWALPAGSMVNSLAFLSAMTIAAIATGTNVRMRRAHLDRLEQERDQRALLAVAEERARIAREMHDIVTHNLSVMVALADAAVIAQPASPGRATAAMTRIAETGRQALTDMRHTLGGGEQPLHPLPGLADLAALAARMRAAGLPTSLDVTGDPGHPTAGAQLAVYRVVQEALTNALKHAPAGSRASVAVHCAQDVVTAEVTDRGQARAPASRASGRGIAGMRERVSAYGGTLEAGPLPEAGWRVAATFRLEAASAR